MRILQVITGLNHGGAQRFVVGLSNELLKAGHEVTVVSLYRGDNGTEFNKQFLNNEVRYHGIKISGLSIFAILKRVNKYLQKEKPDIIHCHLAVLQYIVPTILFSRARVFHTLHSLAQYADGGGGWHARLYRFLYKTSLVVPITVSDECHKSFEQYYHMACDIMISNGCERPQITTAYTSVQEEVNYYKASSDTKVFIHVARFHEAKNQRLLIDAFNALYDRGTDYVLLIVGSGFDSSEAESLTRSACNKIHFLGPRNNVGDYLACSDAFCLTSIYEGLPISLLEAMSMNVVPICTPVGGIVNVIEDGKNGYLARDLSVESFVEAVLRFFSTGEDIRNIAEIYRNHYSMESCAREYVEVFNHSILGRGEK